LNKSFSIIACLFFLCTASACNKKTVPAVFTPASTGPELATVYIYRPNEMTNSLYSPAININGEQKLYAKSGVSSKLSLSPGNHLFEFQAENTYSTLTPLLLDLKAGVIYYIRIDTSLKINKEPSYQPYKRSFKLTQMTEQQAQKEISQCCINSTTRSSKTPPENKKVNGTGFSVDKTQNPFSH